MLRQASLSAAVVAGVVLTALAPGPTSAEPTTPRPPGGDLGTCYVAPNSEFGCEGAICWCCHTDGCFICDKDFGACQWDPAYRIRAGLPARVTQTLQPVRPKQPFTTQPLLKGQGVPGAQPQR